MSLTTDKNNECLNEIKDNGQQECYLILSEEERAKGFVRPYRDSYIHKGRLYDEGIRMLDEPDTSGEKVFVAVANIKVGDTMAGTYLTQEQLDEHTRTGGYIGGCGILTKMGHGIAETYARDPKFYGGTFCVGCGTHLGLHEFVWDGTNEIVGS